MNIWNDYFDNQCIYEIILTQIFEPVQWVKIRTRHIHIYIYNIRTTTIIVIIRACFSRNSIVSRNTVTDVRTIFASTPAKVSRCTITVAGPGAFSLRTTTNSSMLTPRISTTTWQSWKVSCSSTVRSTVGWTRAPSKTSVDLPWKNNRSVYAPLRFVRVCYSNTINKHFHCVRAGCGFSFTRYAQMAQHLLQHQAGLQISDKLGKSTPANVYTHDRNDSESL